MRERERERDTHTHTHTQRQRETETETKKQRETETDRQTENERTDNLQQQKKKILFTRAMESVIVNLKPIPALGQTVPPKHYKTQYQNTHTERERESVEPQFFLAPTPSTTPPTPLYQIASPQCSCFNCTSACKLSTLAHCTFLAAKWRSA